MTEQELAKAMRAQAFKDMEAWRRNNTLQARREVLDEAAKNERDRQSRKKGGKRVPKALHAYSRRAGQGAY